MTFGHFGRLFFIAAFATTALVLPAGPVSVAPVFAASQVGSKAVAAASAAFKGRFSEAGTLADQSGDPAAVKLVELIYLRDNWKTAGYGRIMTFIGHAKQWPLAETLLKRAEYLLFFDNASAQTILNHFANRKPLTPEGQFALARARLASGDQQAARSIVSRTWTTEVFEQATESRASSEFASLLSTSDRKNRLWLLVYKQETNAAIRNAKSLPREYQAAARAAQALIRGTGGAEKAYNTLPGSMRQQLAMQYALARHYRKADKETKASQILVKIPSVHGEIGDPEAWWVERRLVSRMLLKHGKLSSAKTAYQLARSHGYSKGEYLVEGEFLAGWIALRFLNDDTTALKHFQKLADGAVTRTDKARAGYWLGRTHAAMGNQAAAKEAYRDAAKMATVYYGQLAREKLGLAAERIQITGGQPSAAAVSKVENDEVIRAFRMVARAGRDRDLNLFLWSISQRFDSTDEMSAAASIAAELGGPSVAVRLAKLSGQKGIDIDYWGYPTKALPAWKQIGRPVEKALVYGLSRQESEFDPKAGSGAGARGLMQLMPGTAKIIARQYKLGYAPAKLTGDPAYNVKLGAAHLGDLIDDFNGSYVLTLAGYNAGPRRSREWVEAFGDPRGGKVDPVDWIEMIPFTETRGYVQKVMQNVHVYRSRLAPETMRPMTADLERGAPGSIKVANTSEPGSSGCSGKSIVELITGCD
jgi:soluble lytic murein transglycosylase